MPVSLFAPSSCFVSRPRESNSRAARHATGAQAHMALVSVRCLESGRRKGAGHGATRTRDPYSSQTPAPRPVPRTPRPEARARGTGDRFVPGTVLAERYRIVGLLGRGGMGEVYRADDLKLGQAVALKFLPRPPEGDVDRLERLYAEVRTARHVSHPSVCRVWDIGEAEGQHFLSMEFVDGENLASLLRRIGRFPHDKAIDVSRQIAEG